MSGKLKSTIAATAVLTLVNTFGCNLSRTRPHASASPGAPSSAEPVTKTPPRVTITFTPTDNPKKDLDDAIKRLETAFPYRVTYSQKSGDREPVEFVVEYAAADRFGLRDSSGYEFFKIGVTAYSRSPRSPSNGEWIESAARDSIGVTLERSVVTNLPLESQKVKSMGMETLNGVSCYVYTYKMGSPDHNGKAWIGAADGLLYKIDEVAKSFRQGHVFEYVNVEVHGPIIP